MSNAKPPKTLDVEQQQDLLDTLLRKGSRQKTVRKGIRNHLIACLMLDAGLRVGEVVKLKHSHLYFNSIPVKSLILTPSITKNHRERSVPVSSRLAESLRHYFSEWLLPDLVNDDSFCFFTTDPIHALSTRQVENIINTASLKVFGRRINPHMLRHTFASRLLRVTNMRTVQELLGHSCITSTQIYTHPNEDDKKAAIEDLEHEAEGYVKDIEDMPGYTPIEKADDESID